MMMARDGILELWSGRQSLSDIADMFAAFLANQFRGESPDSDATQHSIKTLAAELGPVLLTGHDLDEEWPEMVWDSAATYLMDFREREA